MDTPHQHTAPPPPDLFTHVHKGLRRALFHVGTALGSANGDADRTQRARSQLRQVLHFVEHHGHNEDRLLLPLLQAHLPDVAQQLTAEHTRIHDALVALQAQVDSAPVEHLYRQVAAFTGVYLAHMHLEESVLEPRIRAAVPQEELARSGRRAVDTTPPEDQRMMLAWMLPALPPPEARQFLTRLPAPLAEFLRPLLD